MKEENHPWLENVQYLSFDHISMSTTDYALCGKKCWKTGPLIMIYLTMS